MGIGKAFWEHLIANAEPGDGPNWMRQPGNQDINILDKPMVYSPQQSRSINSSLEAALARIQAEHDKKASK